MRTWLSHLVKIAVALVFVAALGIAAGQAVRAASPPCEQFCDTPLGSCQGDPECATEENCGDPPGGQCVTEPQGCDCCVCLE